MKNKTLRQQVREKIFLQDQTNIERERERERERVCERERESEREREREREGVSHII